MANIKALDKAIDSLKSKVHFDVSQVEHKQILGEASPHSNSTIIYKATHKTTKETLVLKEIALSPIRFSSGDIDLIEQCVKEITREIEVIEKTKNPFIVDVKGIYISKDIDPMIDSEKGNGTYAKLKEAQMKGLNSFVADPSVTCWFLGIAMKLYDGGDLNSYVFKENPSMDIKLQIILDVAEGMAALHAQKLFHRDFKPHQVFVNKTLKAKESRAVVADFGLARSLETSEKLVYNSHNLKDPFCGPITQFVGTETFQPPEQIEYYKSKGKSDIDFFKADVWAFGFVIWILFVKKEDWNQVESRGGKYKAGTMPDVKACSTVPPEVHKIMLDCFELNPSKRPDFHAIVKSMTEVVKKYPK